MIKDKSEASTLFEKLTIEEIQQIEAKTRNEIEKRKEDLRQMVGERYRDLIEAADTIREMKSSVESVSRHVRNMQEFGFDTMSWKVTKKVSTNQEGGREEMKKNFYGVASRIKLLLDIPEKIWCCIESERVLSAAVLFLVARHVHTTLQFELPLHGKLTVLEAFPIVSRHWSSVSHFRNAIFNQCRSMIKAEGIEEQKIAESLCSILLLSKTNLRDVFVEFLEARIECLEDILNADLQTNVKDRVVALIQSIKESFCLIYAVFHRGGLQSETEKGSKANGLLFETVSRLNDTKMELMISVAPPELPWFKYLPQSIKEFVPNVSIISSDVTDDFLKESCQKWLLTVKDRVHSRFEQILSYVGTAKALSTIQEAISEKIVEINNCQQWNDASKTFSQRNFNIWEEILRPLFVGHLQRIVVSHVKNTVTVVEREIELAMNEITNGTQNSFLPECNLSKFIWVEGPGDLPLNGTSFLSSQPTKGGVSNLTLKSKGFTPTIQNICVSLDDRLNVLLEDLSFSVIACHNIERDSSPSEELLAIQNFLKISCQSLIDKLVDFMKCPEVKSNTISSDAINVALLFSRVCLAMCELCPNLQRAVVGFSSKSAVDVVASRRLSHPAVKSSFTKHNEDTVWQEMKAKLTNRSAELLSLWKNSLNEELIRKCRELITEDPAIILKLMPQWDTIEIQEENEDGVSVKSTISVPMQPSCRMESILYWVCGEVNKVGGHIIPRNILCDIQQDFVTAVISQFETRNKSHSRFSSQTYALQLLFDLRFVTLLVMQNKDKEIGDRIQKLVNDLESVVDPFDLDVFSPYINTNLKRCVQRSLMLFGPLVGSNRLGIGSGSRPTIASHQEQHNVLPLSVGCRSRFTLLPLGSSSSSVKSSDKTQDAESVRRPDEGQLRDASTKGETERRSGQSSSSSGLTKSSSASFFGGMSSSWFGY